MDTPQQLPSQPPQNTSAPQAAQQNTWAAPSATQAQQNMPASRPAYTTQTTLPQQTPFLAAQGVPAAQAGYPVQQNAYLATPYPAQPQIKQPSGWARLWAALGLAFAVLIIQGFSIFIALPTRSDDAMITTGEIIGGLAALLFIVLLGGKRIATPSMQGMRETWRILRWLFLADGVLVLIEAIDIAVTGSFQLAEMWPLRLIMLALMCAGIGLFEEGTFRGLVFHGLLSRMGTNKKGILWAIIISSLIFGAMHIDPVSVDLTDPLQALQAILKIAQTGIFGFAAAVAVLKTENIWPVALLHGLNDFMLMFSEIGLAGEPLTTEYVSSGSDAWAIVAIYIILCAAYAPCIVSALRTLKTIGEPNRGAFYRGASLPLTPYNTAYAPHAYNYTPAAAATTPAASPSVAPNAYPPSSTYTTTTQPGYTSTAPSGNISP